MNAKMDIVSRPVFIDYLAPDNSEIRLLKDGSNGGLCECTLGPGAVTAAVSHRVVEEVWYVVSGYGTLWRSSDDEPRNISAGDSLLIPVGVEFQFSASEHEPLVMILATMPPWSVELEADGPDPAKGYWETRAPSEEWRIQGDWWQLTAGDDGNVQLARIRIARIAPLTYKLEGQSWEAGWKPRATFGSEYAEFLPTERILRYKWTGYHAERPYSGSAEVLFTTSHSINRAAGYYDLTLGDGVIDVIRRNCVYSRMSPGENLGELLDDGSSFQAIFEAHFAPAAETIAEKAG